MPRHTDKLLEFHSGLRNWSRLATEDCADEKTAFSATVSTKSASDSSCIGQSFALCMETEDYVGIVVDSPGSGPVRLKLLSSPSPLNSMEEASHGGKDDNRKTVGSLQGTNEYCRDHKTCSIG